MLKLECSAESWVDDAGVSLEEREDSGLGLSSSSRLIRIKIFLGPNGVILGAYKAKITTTKTGSAKCLSTGKINAAVAAAAWVRIEIFTVGTREIESGTM